MVTAAQSIEMLREHVRRQLRLFGLIDAYVALHDDVPPELVDWRRMFRESLDNYRDLCNMSVDEWSSLTLTELVQLSEMLGKAQFGLLQWFLPSALVLEMRPLALY